MNYKIALIILFAMLFASATLTAFLLKQQYSYYDTLSDQIDTTVPSVFYAKLSDGPTYFAKLNQDGSWTYVKDYKFDIDYPLLNCIMKEFYNTNQPNNANPDNTAIMQDSEITEVICSSAILKMCAKEDQYIKLNCDGKYKRGISFDQIPEGVK